jgi:hypothetical protein
MIETVIENDVAVTHYNNGTIQSPCAKRMHTTDGSTFWLKTYHTKLYNPFTWDARKHNDPDCKFIVVNEDAYELYMKYLDTHSEAYYAQAARKLHERM